MLSFKRILLCVIMIVIVTGCSDRVTFTPDLIKNSSKLCDVNGGVKTIEIIQFPNSDQERIRLNCINGAEFYNRDTTQFKDRKKLIQ